MKMNDELLKYLSDLMTEVEKKEFENKLRESTELNKELKAVKQFLNRTRNLEQSSDGSGYFINLLPRTRAKIAERRKSKFNFNPAYLIPVTVIILFFVFFPIKNQSPISVENRIIRMTDSSQNELLNVLNENVSLTSVETESDLDDLLDTELSHELNEIGVLNTNIRYVDTDDLLNNLSQNEIDIIYNELMSKKIL